MTISGLLSFSKCANNSGASRSSLKSNRRLTTSSWTQIEYKSTEDMNTLSNLGCFCSRRSIVPTLARQRLNQNRDADLMEPEEETASVA